ncbi:MarR family transcriptional regulator [Kitasatospora sp. NBC_01287]|uniref:MarR family winged helix-turn-helix transcriptional regulator n=1 Tax=Kitasatospora sp. NBC_01287 TaxID=2903573 RepID=UPI00224E23B3|nr:MarR family transcriptional regulator [Kitasatospora sp. NBC_01287]MCX4747496.1 MarR family transcriptional regulator [Kitasatospora sp. NBC_01287]
MALAPEDSPGFLLWHATLRWERRIAAALAPLDLTHPQFVLLAGLWYLDAQGGRPNQLELARHTGTDVKTASQVIRRLEAKEFLIRQVDAVDTRMKRLAITERGAVVAVAALEVVERADAAFFAAVPDRAAVLAVLRPLAHGDEDHR